MIPQWIMAGAAMGTLIIAVAAARTVHVIHVLVNAKMSAALEEIAKLTEELAAERSRPPHHKKN